MTYGNHENERSRTMTMSFWEAAWEGIGLGALTEPNALELLDHLEELDDEGLCQRVFMDEHEALCAGMWIGRKLAERDSIEEPNGD